MTDPTTTAAAVIARDDRRVRWLTRLTLALWLLVMAAVLAVLGVQSQVIAPKQRVLHDLEAEMSAAKAGGDKAEAERLERRFLLIAGMVTLAVYYGIAALAVAVGLLGLAVAVSLWLTFAVRRATLRQIHASLADIAAQLADLRRAGDGSVVG